MPNYDSDSSDSASNTYTTTNVTLGYASTDAAGDEISHVGGYPTWLDQTKTPPANLSKCQICNGHLSLLLQLNADLQQYFPNDERRLHIFCCRKKTCSRKIGSVRAFREVRKPQAARKLAQKTTQAPAKAQNEKPPIDLGAALFGANPNSQSSNVNPFSTSASTTSTTNNANPFASIAPPSTLAAKPPQRPEEPAQSMTATFAEKLNISSPTPSKSEQPQVSEPWPQQSDFPLPFPSYFLEAYVEELEPTPSTNDPGSAIAGSSKTQYDADDSTNNNNSSAPEKDSFESTLDKTFQKFSDRIAQNPDQILRYEFKGQPLLYSGADGVSSRFVVPHGKQGAVRGVPRCETCSAQRVFEIQLVPGLIYELEKEDNNNADVTMKGAPNVDLDEGMEWGTIIMCTCVSNCGEAGEISFREEWVGVQWEERVARK